MILGDESRATLPARWGVVKNVVDLEAVREHGNQVIELDAEEDIILIDVGVDEGELGRVTRVEERVASDLEHRSNTSTTSDHAELRRQVGSEDELALGTLDTDVIPNLEL